MPTSAPQPLHAITDAPPIQWLELDRSRIAYADVGIGETAVAIHCSGGNGGQWASLAGRVARRIRTLAPDLYGNGKSDRWHGHHALNLAEEAAIVRALADRAGGLVHLVGHSYGGGVALRAAMELGDRVASVVLVEPSAFQLLRQSGGNDARLFAEIADKAAEIVGALGRGDYRAGTAAFVDYWNEPGTFEEMDGRRQASLSARLPAIAPHFSALCDEPLTLADMTSRLTMPVLILQGSRSPAPSRRISGMLAAALPRASLHIIRGVGHMAPVTQPQRVVPLIADFLERQTVSTQVARLRVG